MWFETSRRTPALLPVAGVAQMVERPRPLYGGRLARICTAWKGQEDQARGSRNPPSRGRCSRKGKPSNQVNLQGHKEMEISRTAFELVRFPDDFQELVHPFSLVVNFPSAALEGPKSSCGAATLFINATVTLLRCANHGTTRFHQPRIMSRSH